MDYDVVVVGAGPAGSAAARDIAREGWKVLLIEEHEVVGQPIYCSGLVSPRTLELASGRDGLVLNQLRGAIVHSVSGKELHLGGDKVYALAIDREALDHRLAEQAEAASAELRLGTKLTGIRRENGRLKLFIDGKGGSNQLRAKLLLGADGASSAVSRWLGVYDLNGIIRAVSAEARLKLMEADKVRVFVGRSLAPGWFGWIIPLGDGRVRIGIGDSSHSIKAPTQLLRELLMAFPAEFKGIEPDRIRAKVIPIYSPMKTYGDNVLLVGDAARQVKPTSGGGIYTGLVGAKHCARVAVQALEEDNFSEAFLSRYEASWKGELGAELERGIDLRRVFVSLSNEEIDRLLTLLGTPPLPKAIKQFGDIDFPSPMFGHLVKVAPLLRLFVRLPLGFLGRWMPWISGAGGISSPPSN